MRIISHSPDQTRQIGEALGRMLVKGAVVALVGELGAGKTVFAQGLAGGLGVAPDEYVSSPSFTLVNQYRGRVSIFHVDTYRLTNEAEMVALGYEEYFDPEGVTIIEWANKVQDLLPVNHIIVTFRFSNERAREISIELSGSWPARMESEISGMLDRLDAGKT